MQNKEDEEIRKQEEIELQKQIKHQTFINMSLQTKIENMDNVIKKIIESEDVNKMHEVQEILTPYISMLTEAIQELKHLIINGYNGILIMKASNN